VEEGHYVGNKVSNFGGLLDITNLILWEENARSVEYLHLIGSLKVSRQQLRVIS